MRVLGSNQLKLIHDQLWTGVGSVTDNTTAAVDRLLVLHRQGDSSPTDFMWRIRPFQYILDH